MNIAAQFTVFSLVGVAAAIGHYGVLIALSELAGTQPVPASLAGYLVGGLISYVLNYRYTFRSTKQHREAVVKFAVAAGIGFVLNGVIMAVLTGLIALHYLPAQIVTTGLVLIWSFSCYRYWAFR